MCWLDQVQLSRRAANLLQLLRGHLRRSSLPQCRIPLLIFGLSPFGRWLPLVVRFGASWVWLALFGGALCPRLLNLWQPVLLPRRRRLLGPPWLPLPGLSVPLLPVPLLDGRFPLRRVQLLLPRPRLQLLVGSLGVVSDALFRLLRFACIAFQLPLLLLLLPRVQDLGGLWLGHGRLLGRAGPEKLLSAVIFFCSYVSSFSGI